MFYTLVSKISLIPKGPNYFLIIFAFGSLAYILLSYYVNTFDLPNYIEKYKNYLYIIMILDLFIAYFLSNDSSEKYSEEDKKNIEQKIENLKNIEEQKKIYNSQIEELQKQKKYQLELQKQKSIQNFDEEESVAKSNQSPFKTIEEAEEDDKKEQQELE